MEWWIIVGLGVLAFLIYGWYLNYKDKKEPKSEKDYLVLILKGVKDIGWILLIWFLLWAYSI